MNKVQVPAPRRSRNRLRDVAILEISFDGRGIGLEYPCEVGLAFCDGRGPLSWSVEAEDRWRPAADPAALNSMSEFGAGLPGTLVAEQLQSATMGLRVFAECHMPANAWLKKLSSASGVGIDMRVRDIRSLIVPRGTPAEAPLPDGFGWAFQRSRRAVPPVSRAIVDAMRHAKFLCELQAMSVPP